METITSTTIATAAPTQMDYLPVPTVLPPSSQPVTTYQFPAPILGILAGCVCTAGFQILGRRNRRQSANYHDHSPVDPERGVAREGEVRPNGLNIRQ